MSIDQQPKQAVQPLVPEEEKFGYFDKRRYQTPEAKRKMKRNGIGAVATLIVVPIVTTFGIKAASGGNPSPDCAPESNTGPAVPGEQEPSQQPEAEPQAEIIYEAADSATDAPELANATFNQPGWTLDSYPYVFTGIQTGNEAKDVSRDELKGLAGITTEQAPTADDAFRIRFIGQSLQGLLNTGFNANEAQLIKDNGFMPFQDMPLNPGQAARGMYDPTIIEAIAAKDAGKGAGGEGIQLLFGDLSQNDPTSDNVVKSERGYYKNFHEQILYLYENGRTDEDPNDYSVLIGSDVTDKNSAPVQETGKLGEEGYKAQKVVTLTLRDNGDLIPEIAQSRLDAGLQANMETTITMNVTMIEVDGKWLVADSEILDVTSNND